MALSWTNVTKRFGEITAVSGLTLEVKAGEIFGLLGPNGAGKSTSMAMAVGLLKPDEGSVRIDAGDPMDPVARRSIGLAPQALSLYEDLTAEENLHFYCEVYSITGARRNARTGELLELAGLSDRGRSRVSTFSGGMKRRLNFVAAIVHDPPLILLDEPTAGVDPQSRNALFDLVKHQRGAGKTIIYTTHYMEEAQKLCDRVGIIDRGRLLALDTVPNLIRAHGGRSQVSVTTDAGEEHISTDDPMGEISRRHGVVGVRSVSLREPDLESVFLNLTGRSLRD
ncbi:MAG TPA: ABC transporter ATP-binding protein [Phycisphaerales bacterium]|nr:ABC transporter ATP-binding protein [Phycisphaerales bacterium]